MFPWFLNNSFFPVNKLINNRLEKFFFLIADCWINTFALLGKGNVHFSWFPYFKTRGTSLEVQWLGLRAFTAGGMDLIPGQGTKIPHAVRHSQIKKLKNKNTGARRWCLRDTPPAVIQSPRCCWVSPHLTWATSLTLTVSLLYHSGVYIEL